MAPIRPSDRSKLACAAAWAQAVDRSLTARFSFRQQVPSARFYFFPVPGAKAAKITARNELMAAEHGLVRAVLRAAHARAPLAYQTHTPHRPQTLFQPPPALWQVLSL